jgi:outer membrane lipoprotein-sorting protein
MTPPTLDDFTFELLGEEAIDGLDCWEIAMIPVDDDVADENGFSKRVSFYRKDCFVIRRSTYYDLDGELHKELNVLEIKELDPENHKYRPLQMEMVNKQNDRQSLFKVEAIAFNPDVKDEYFTTRYLERE